MPRRMAILLAGFVLSAVTLIGASVLIGPNEELSAGPTPIVVIVMENHEYGAVVSAPYLSLFASQGRLFTNYHAITHPSLPNYLAMTSGQTLCSNNDCARPFTSAKNVFRQLGRAGFAWRAYAESMPSPCYKDNAGSYAVRHNPPPYYSNLVRACPKKNLPLPSTLPSTLQPFTFVTPNVCNDMHDCSVTTGDNWLANHVPAFLEKGAIVVITFDEGSTSEGGGGHVYTAAVGPGIPAGTTDATSFTHYSLLAALEDHWGLPRIGNAVGKAPLPLSSQPSVVPAQAATTSRSGVFSVKCTFSHRNSDDPITLPGQPGAAHSHDFFGNKSVNASSTYSSMRAAGTTCRAKSDTAGYWIPTLLDPNNQPVTAAHMNVYYRGDAGTKTIPADLRMVAGATAGSPTGTDRVFWSCGQTDTNVHSPTIVNCPGDQLTLTVAFPSCWDGVLTHANDTAHLSYDAGCKSGVDLARVAINVKWDVQNAKGYKLSSDIKLGTTRGRSAHADFWNTWDQTALDAVIQRCLNGGLDCKNFTG